VKAIKKFSEFIKLGIVKKQTPDISRAEFLIKESAQNRAFLLNIMKKIGITDENANSIVKLCYDVLMEIIRAKMILEGYSASGLGAHEAEVSYLRVLAFSENDVQFVDQIRFFRNGMLYYGTILDKEYAEKVLNFINKIYSKLKELVNSKN